MRQVSWHCSQHIYLFLFKDWEK